MTTYRYLGWGKTNSDGIAKLNHNSEGQEIEHSYTGTGAGEIDVLASLDNPIAEGSIVSVTYGVLDCIFYDTGVTGTYNQNWVKTNVIANPTDNGTECTPSSAWAELKLPTHSYIDDLPFRMEFEVVSVTDVVRWYFWYNSSSDQGLINLATGKYSIDVTSTGITVKKDNVTVTTLNAPSTLNSMEFSFTTTSSRLTFKEFKVYPI